MDLASLLLIVVLLRLRLPAPMLFEHPDVHAFFRLDLLARTLCVHIDLRFNVVLHLGFVLLIIVLVVVLLVIFALDLRVHLVVFWEVLLLVVILGAIGIRVGLGRLASALRRTLVALAHIAAATAGRLIAHAGHGSTQECGERKEELHCEIGVAVEGIKRFVSGWSFSR